MNLQNEQMSSEPKVRVQYILSVPSLPMRCQHLSALLEDVSSKDSNYILQLIIDSLFGVTEDDSLNIQQQNLGGGWGIRVITLSEHFNEFNSLRNFLSPTGPLLSMIYRLTHDPFQLLPFPIAWLPLKVRTEIEEGTASVFYTNKIQTLGPGKPPTNIMLNSFEYYMFHFTHFLVGSHTHRWNLSWGPVNDALYLTLLEDYLNAFLPCDGSLPPGPQSVPVSPRGVLSPMAQRHGGQIGLPSPGIYLSNVASPIMRTFRSPDSHHGPQPFFELNSIAGTATSSPIVHQSFYSSHQAQREANLWTSQVVFQVLLEMWINQCVPPAPRSSVAPTQSPSSSTTYQPPSMCNSLMDFIPLQYRPNWCANNFKDVFIPSSDHVRVVRIMVKHFHYFTNSIKINQETPLDHLKRNLWQMCHRSFYLFLKHLFNHWPLDSSFRLVLETWLSFIQPWRYVHLSAKGKSPNSQQTEDGPRITDKKWMGFVAENLLFYTHFFNLLIGRLLRLDLVSPKNAQLLFRVAKVFSQENLAVFIQEIEDTLLSGNSMQKNLLAGAASINGPLPSSPLVTGSGYDQFMPQQLLKMARSHILEVEGPNHQYTPLFSEAVAAKISHFLKVAKRAQDAIAAELVSNCALANDKDKSWIGWISSIYKSLFDTSQNVNDENTLAEVQRSLAHIEVSIKQFCSTFKVSQPFMGSVDFPDHSFSSFRNVSGIVGSPEKYHEPDMVASDNGPVLTSLGRYQLLNGLRRYDLKYEGDPDLRPICTYEIKLFVRILHRISLFLNNKYKYEMLDLFHRSDYLGSVARVFLCRPLTIYNYCKEDPDIPRQKVAKVLPPRLSLRFLANKQLLGLILGFYFLLYLFRFPSLTVTVCFFVPLIVTWVLLKAAFESTFHREPSSEGSLRHSFQTPR